MASSAEEIRRFASKCHELASTCTTSFAKDALIDAAERVERKPDGLDGTKIQRGHASRTDPAPAGTRLAKPTPKFAIGSSE